MGWSISIGDDGGKYLRESYSADSREDLEEMQSYRAIMRMNESDRKQLREIMEKRKGE
tara:strand:+ start:37 stop:210 length:174 start_codon:yes stop_codon:yes gene_type:complete